MLGFDSHFAVKMPGLRVTALKVAVEKVEDRNVGLEELKIAVAEEVRSKYSLESVKDVKVFRFYRDFFWRLGIDPTKVRPASEALIRRILQGGSIPTINTAVDAINISSIQTEIVVDAFDVAKISGEAKIRFASRGDRFLGIGMARELTMTGGEIVISDDLGPIAIYPHRDSVRTGVSLQTKAMLTVMCGVPGIGEEMLADAAKVVSRMVTRFCEGMNIGQSMSLPK
ncbi:MAG: phenylalanine--tRNA ligase beta subunit-related protein [Promethearchaeati archaeon SRVP18_Atabeyarchaeia-1]